MIPDDIHALRLPQPVPGSCEDPFERWPGDVIVDFPSVTALVDRMREAFFAGDTERQAAQASIEVSASQAVRGARVVVDVPLPESCRACGGWGEAGGESCAACHGSGHRVVIEPVLVMVPSGVRDGARFRVKLGAGASPRHAIELLVRVR